MEGYVIGVECLFNKENLMYIFDEDENKVNEILDFAHAVHTVYTLQDYFDLIEKANELTGNYCRIQNDGLLLVLFED